jgi:two-component sensor histidine kinase
MPATDEGVVKGFANAARDMTAQKMLEESALFSSQLEYSVADKTQQLEATLEELQRKNEEIAGYSSMISSERRENKVLLHEVYHRVKNNLQVIESLLKIKSRSLSDATARAAIDTSIQRVHVMAMVHERLYQMPDLAGVSLVAYLRALIGVAIASHSQKPGQVELEFDVDEVPLALDMAIPFGLLMNELISNCLDHGLSTAGAGKIHVSVRHNANGVRVVVKDNGIGLPEGFDPARGASVGLKLAVSLARQLGGTLQFTSSHGCQVQVDLTRLAEQVKAEHIGIAQNMVTATHFNPLSPSQY